MSNDLDEPLFILPYPRGVLWLSFTALFVVGVFAVFVGATNIRGLWWNDPTVVPLKGGGVMLVSGTTRNWWIAFYVAAYFVGPAIILPVFGVLIFRDSPMTIGKSGIVMGKLTVSWDQVQGCRWNRYNPGQLEIRLIKGRPECSIPARYRAEVEAVLRKLGKWEG